MRFKILFLMLFTLSSVLLVSCDGKRSSLLPDTQTQSNTGEKEEEPRQVAPLSNDTGSTIETERDDATVE